MGIKLTDRFLFNVFVWSAPFLLFMNVVSFETKNSIGGIGTNLFVYYLALLFAIGLRRRKRRDLGLLLLFFIVTFIFVKNIVREAGNVAVGDLLVLIRSYAFFTIHYFLGSIYLDSENARVRILRIIGAFTIISAIIGILHYHFFYSIPFIDLKYATDEFGAVLFVKDLAIMRFRETSIFFGPNVFAYMLVFGYICYFQTWTIDKLVTGERGRAKILGVTALIVYALVVTDSRSALFLLLIFILINVVRRDAGMFIRIVVPVAIVVSACALLAYSQRFSLAMALNDPRFLKLYVAYTLLNQSLLNWVIGLPAGSAWDTGGVPFSDNLYGALLLEGGFVLILMLGIFTVRMKRKIDELSLKASLVDQRYLLAAKYSLLFFLLYGLFAIPTSMTCLFNYLGLLLGGATRIMNRTRHQD